MPARRLLLFLLALFAASSSRAQYPFEKSTAIRYRRFQRWTINERSETKADYSIVIPSFFARKGSLGFRMFRPVNRDSSTINVYRDGKILQTFSEPSALSEMGPLPQAAFVEDINGDGLNDLKVLVPENGCCGAYNYYLRVIYLLQNRNGRFTKISFTDLMMDYAHRPERDVDGDGRFEVVTQTFQSEGGHNYWVFNLYNFNGAGLVNVNRRAGYPIMVQLLYRNNYKVAGRISRARMRQFARPLPDGYESR